MGTPDFAVPTLLELAKNHEIIAVYTRAPKPKGRGLEMLKTPVHNAAIALDIPVFTPKSLKTETQFQALKADVCVVVAYGLLLPQNILDATKLGCYNLHGSLLPRWRGAAPLQRAIMAGDAKTGVMVMKMDIGLDTGDIALTHELAINPTDTTQNIHDSLAISGASLMVDAMEKLENNALLLTKQPSEGILYAAKIDKSETKINFDQDAKIVDCHIRGLSPFPGAWCMIKGERVKILRSIYSEKSGNIGEIIDLTPTIACKTGAITLLELQKAGGKPMSGAQFMRGANLRIGDNIENNDNVSL